MNVVGIAGIAVCAAVIAAMLRKYHPEYAVLLSIAASVVILLEIFKGVAPAIKQIRTLFSASGMSTDYILILLKTLGISFLAQFAADACRDAEEEALASKMELAGKIAIVVLSLPLFKKIAETAVNLIGG
ncbi:MAG: Stage III sporulation protein AD [Oscillospiraceae bacterium]|jgi:stage III sporulation protein AD